MFRQIWIRFALLLGCLGMLANCGNASAPAAGSAPTPRPTDRQQPTVAATTDRPATTAAALAPTTRAAGPTAAQPAPAAAPAGIPEGLTPEGYHYLGRPDAPVTLVMYSDFL